MYVKTMCGSVVSESTFSGLTKGLLDFYDPPTRASRNYKNWIAILDLRICLECRSRHGKIYQVDEIPDKEPPIHPRCRCRIKTMRAVGAGNGTKEGTNGADWWMKYFADLPEYYITQEELKNWDGQEEKLLLNLLLERWYPWESTRTMIIIYHKISGEFGLRRISIITAGGEMVIACYGQMTGCCLSPTTTPKRI